VGLGAVVLRSQGLFEAIRWAGVAYLAYLGVQTLLRVRREPEVDAGAMRTSGRRVAWVGWRQGFVSNITNPKVLVFYIAVLPQFLTADSAPVFVFALAVTHALLSLAWLQLVVLMLGRARRWFTRRSVRRAMDATTGTLLLAFSARLAVEHA
jgi:threonine/homoserine/homoserine lactone efflux protein